MGLQKVNKYEYDPEKAKELLKEAGWEDRDNDGWVENEKGEKLEIVWTAYNDVAWPQELVAVAKENWKEIGVRLEGELMEFNAVSDKVYDERNFDLFNMGWSLSIDPDLRGIFDKASDSPGGYNSMGFYNEEAEQIMAQGILETDFEKRKAMYQRWAEIANEELPYLFIAYR
ncbi:ABC transporter substrate-binding protein [Brassicibacter mesophilus]|uniref:ABC transporter substrate-binding protein n=1 Tax=Brassicibacter mesophilus TaxID=745119 RepID=UPI003D2199CF